MLLSFFGDKHENKHSLKRTRRDIQLITIRLYEINKSFGIRLPKLRQENVITGELTCGLNRKFGQAIEFVSLLKYHIKSVARKNLTGDILQIRLVVV